MLWTVTHGSVFYLVFNLGQKILKISKTALKVLFSVSDTWNLGQNYDSTDQFRSKF